MCGFWAVAFIVGLLIPTALESQELGRALSTMMMPGLDSSTPVWSADESHVVFILDLDFDGEQEFYSAAVDGSGSQLLTSRVGVTFRFLVTPDSQRVLFLERAEPGEDVGKLMSVPIGGGTPVELSAALPEGRNVGSFAVTPDSQTVVFETLPTPTQVFAIPTTGGALTPLDFGFADSQRQLIDFFPVAGSQRMVYTADLFPLFQIGLYSAPLDGGPPTQLHEDLSGNNRVTFVELSPDGSRAIYETLNRILFSVPTDGSSPAQTLTILSMQGRVSGDSSHVYYPTSNGGAAFLRQPLAGGPPEVLAAGVFFAGGWQLGRATENILSRDSPARQLRSVISDTGQNFFLNAGLTGSLVGPDFRFSRDESFAVWSSFFD
ncbi:MAG: hypothetical protein AAFY88_12020, partial [Acidobacteriota bacterium]